MGSVRKATRRPFSAERTKRDASASGCSGRASAIYRAVQFDEAADDEVVVRDRVPLVSVLRHAAADQLSGQAAAVRTICVAGDVQCVARSTQHAALRSAALRRQWLVLRAACVRTQ